MRRRLALSALLGLAACGPGEAPGGEQSGAAGNDAMDDGAFVRVGGLPIDYAEVQDVAKHYRSALPAASANEVERLALTAYLIPRAAFARRYSVHR